MEHFNKSNRSQTILSYEKYLQIKGYQERSVKKFVQIVQEYENYPSDNLETYYQYLKTRIHKQNPNKTLSKSTLNYHIYGLKMYIKYLERFGLVSPENRSISLLKEKTTLKNIEILTQEEVKMLFDNAQNSRDKAALSCLYHLGLRAAEACNLELEDLDFKENLVFVSKSKTGYQRQIPLPKKAKEIFEHYLKVRSSKSNNTVFLQGLRGKLTPDGLFQIVKRTTKKSPITKPVYPHLLRHCIATHLLKNKMEIEQVAHFLGHKSLESTQRYTHLIEDFRF